MLEGRTRDPSVVYENAKTLLARGYLVVETGNIFLLADVALKWDYLAIDIIAVLLLGNGVEFFSCPADDVYFGAVDSESLGDHQTDSGPTA